MYMPATYTAAIACTYRFASDGITLMLVNSTDTVTVDVQIWAIGIHK